MKVKYVENGEGFENLGFILGTIYEVERTDNNGDFWIFIDGELRVLLKREVELIDESKDTHYDNTNGSLYKFAVDHNLNAFEFDICKRIVRCRKKGQFREDLEKTIRVIELYLKEMG